MSIITIAETGAEIFEATETDLPRPEFTGYADGFHPTTLPVGTGNTNVAEFYELVDGLLVDMARDDDATSYLARVVARGIRAYAADRSPSETIAFVVGVRDTQMTFAGNDLSFIFDTKPVTKALDNVHAVALAAIIADTFADDEVVAVMHASIKAALVVAAATPEARPGRRRNRRRRGGSNRSRG